MITFINYLLAAGVLQGLVFIIVTLVLNKKLSKVILYLNLCVLFISFNNLQACLIEFGFSSNNFYLEHLLVPWYVLIMPMFYMFLVNFLKVEDKFGNILKLIVNIFILELILRSSVIGWVYMAGPESEYLIASFTAIEEISNLIITLLIFRKCWVIVFEKAESYDFIKKLDKINWIKAFLKIGVLIMAFWSLAVIVSNATGDLEYYYPLRLATSILIYWISYQGFLRYQVVEDKILLGKFMAIRHQLTDISYSSEISKNECLDKKHYQQFEDIDTYIIDNLKFLDPNLSLDSMAEELRMSASHLSKLINAHSGYNFSDYINFLRIEQAKQMLSDKSYELYTNVAIGLESGFNSKSTFYSAFKKFTSDTPSNYRQIEMVR